MLPPSSVPSETLVNIVDLSFAYDRRPVLTGINLEIPRGKVVAIMGGSGCGKTTLLRLIGGQIKPQSGTLTVAGQNVHDLDQRGLYQLRRRMGMLFQFGALFTDMSVYDNVAFQMREHTDLPEELIRDLVLMKLNAVGLRGAHNLMPSELVRRHGASRGAGAGDRAGPDAHHVRRAVRRAGSDFAGRGRATDPQAQRCAGSDVRSS